MFFNTTKNLSVFNVNATSRRPAGELITRNPTARLVQSNLFARKPSTPDFVDLPQGLEFSQIRFNEDLKPGFPDEEGLKGVGRNFDEVDGSLFAEIPKVNNVEKDQIENSAFHQGASNFGMAPGELKERISARAPEFFQYTKMAMDLRAKKAATNRYTWQKTKYEDGGEIFQERVLVRRQTKTWTDCVLDKAGLNGEKAQAAFNRLGQTVRDLTGIPRKTGSSYVGTKGVAPLLHEAKAAPIDVAWIAQGVGKVAASTAATEGASALKAGFEGASAALTYAAAPLAVVDAMGAANEFLKTRSERDRNKAIVLAHHGGYLRFLRKVDANKPHTITSEEVNAFLSFTAAAQKLFNPTRRESRIVAAMKARFARLAVIQPLTVATGSGIAIASQVVGAIPVAAVVAGPLTMIAAAVEIREAKQTRLRRLDQQRRALERKEAMKAVVEGMGEGDPRLELLKGIVAGLSAHQDDLITQAKREKGYAHLQAGKAGATIGGVAAFTVAAGAAIGGVIAGAALGPLGPLVALPALGFGGAVFKRGRERASEARTWKWRQRAVVGMALTRNRVEMEQFVKEQGASIKVNFQEGEYLAEEQRFAGTREMEVRADQNAYVCLHVLALQVQDIVQSRVSNNSCVQLLNALKIDAIDLFAICQNASFKKGKAQLDYIQSQLAIKLELPLSLEGDTQPLSHPSVFISNFEKQITERFEPAFLEFAAEIQQGIPKDIWKKMPKLIQSKMLEQNWEKIPQGMQDKVSPILLEKISNKITSQGKILQAAWAEIPEEGQERIQQEFLKTVQQEIRELFREELKNSFSNDAYMSAFDAVIGKFLEDTKHLPDSQLTKLLRATVPDPSMDPGEELMKFTTPSVKSGSSEAKADTRPGADESLDLLDNISMEPRFPPAPKVHRDGQWDSLDDELEALYASPPMNGGENSRDSSSDLPIRQDEPLVPDAVTSAPARDNDLNWLDDELRELEVLPLSQTVQQREKDRQAGEIDEKLRMLEGNIKASQFISHTRIRA